MANPEDLAGDAARHCCRTRGHKMFLSAHAGANLTRGPQIIGLMFECVAISFLFNSSDSLIRTGRRPLIIFTAG